MVFQKTIEEHLILNMGATILFKKKQMKNGVRYDPEIVKTWIINCTADCSGDFHKCQLRRQSGR